METNNSNVDIDEIAKFDAQASQWWDPHSQFKPLHDINPLRLKYINDIAPLNGKEILDIGCGGGILSESMAGLGGNVTGIDMAKGPLTVARLHALETGTKIQYEQITTEEKAKNHAAHYDIITCMELLEHVPDPVAILRSISHMLKPGGDAFFSTINRNLKAYLFAIIGAEYILQLLPKGTHDYNKFIKPSELDDWLRQTQLDLEDITGMVYNPITKHYKLNPNDVDVNYIVHAKKR